MRIKGNREWVFISPLFFLFSSKQSAQSPVSYFRPGTGREHYEFPIYLVRSFSPIEKEMTAVD